VTALYSPIVQSAEERALWVIMNVTGEMNRRVHKIGINLTSIQNTVKIPIITRILIYKVGQIWKLAYDKEESHKVQLRKIGSIGNKGLEVFQEEKCHHTNG